jgi:hypothetical protein
MIGTVAKSARMRQCFPAAAMIGGSLPIILSAS